MIRGLILLSIALTVSLVPAATRAQQPSRTAVLGVLMPSIRGTSDPLIDAMRNGLRELGYVEGQNIRIGKTSAENVGVRFDFLSKNVGKKRRGQTRMALT